ncbi:MAG: hypothetical protein ACRDJ4_08645 [Actinomycetota bacterium]
MLGSTAVVELGCGCAVTIDDDGGLGDPVSWCGEHAGRIWGVHSHGYVCGECGFVTYRFDRLERHVYGEHLGVHVA